MVRSAQYARAVTRSPPETTPLSRAARTATAIYGRVARSSGQSLSARPGGARFKLCSAGEAEREAEGGGDGRAVADRGRHEGGALRARPQKMGRARARAGTNGASARGDDP